MDVKLLAAGKVVLCFKVKPLTIGKVVCTAVLVVVIFVVVDCEKVAVACTVEVAAGSNRETDVETLVFCKNRLAFVFRNASVVS